MLTPRENLLSVFHHQNPEWIPITGHNDPYNRPHPDGMPAELAEVMANVQWGDESTVAFSRYLGLDVMDFYMAPIGSRSPHVTREEKREGNDLYVRWQTPRGELTEHTRYSPDTGLWYTVEHQVKDAGDIPAFASLYADQEFFIDPAGVERLKQRRALIADDGIIACAMSGTPLGQMIRVHSGVETIAYLWADHRRELHELFAVMADNHYRYLQLGATLPEIDVLIGMDDTSTTTQSPEMFAEFNLGYTDECTEIMHAAAKLYFHHSCGLIHDLLDLYRQTKMDAVHGYTTTPIGDVSIAEGRQLLGPRITMMVGLVQLCFEITDRDALARSIQTMYEEAGRGDHFVMSIAPDPGKTMEEITFVANECHKYQRMYR